MVDALEQLVDAVTVSYGPLNGQTEYMLLEYTLHGTNSRFGGDAVPYGRVKLGINNPIFPFGWQGFSQGTVVGTFSSGVFPFTYGQAFPLWFKLESIGGTGVGSGRPTGVKSSQADFYNTVAIAGVFLYDQNMNVLSENPVISSDLGISYSNLSTPEPLTSLLLPRGALVLALAFAFRRLKDR